MANGSSLIVISTAEIRAGSSKRNILTGSFDLKRTSDGNPLGNNNICALTDLFQY